MKRNREKNADDQLYSAKYRFLAYTSNSFKKFKPYFEKLKARAECARHIYLASVSFSVNLSPS